MKKRKVSENTSKLLEGVRQGDVRMIARAITLVENGFPDTSSLMKRLQNTGECKVVGITGPPGAGKSTLVNALIGHWIEQKKRIAVVAVDPSSPFNFGALLGDRIRLSGYYTHPDVYIRSLASRGSLGGLHPNILHVTDLLKEAPFDLVLVETVGVGQSEVEIAALADCTVVVVVPEAGDEIQMMKSGVLEIADVFVVNKGDRPGSDGMVKRLQNLVHEKSTPDSEIPVYKTVATEQTHTAEVAKAIEKVLAGKDQINDRRVKLLSDKILQTAAATLLKDVDRNALEKNIKDQNAQVNVYQESEKIVDFLIERGNS